MSKPLEVTSDVAEEIAWAYEAGKEGLPSDYSDADRIASAIRNVVDTFAHERGYDIDSVLNAIPTE